ncbi:MAG: trypsin-like peptidase domain-containing protein, partial [Candidatus Hydrogenedentes bacterium]|nr:trypsin-like peptidase domain-containing protein [Candidatus Hydrogenedentota bacterium]
MAGFLLLGALSVVPLVHAVDVEIDKPTPTILSDIPWVPAPQTSQPKVIYGTDDRIDLYQETDPERRVWAASTCGLLRSSSLQENGDGTFSIQTSAYNVCSDEPFAAQPTAAFCSGFMVGEDIIATAGHCFDTNDLGSVRFVFGFVMEDANTPVLTVPGDQVYTGVELLGQALAGSLDYAVVRVDRAIVAPGATPFELRREGIVAIGASVGVIGHPSGLPLKIAFGDNTVVRSSSDSGFFVTNLDTYGGNSGSPVMDQATGLLEGILVRGETDFISVDFDSDGDGNVDGICQRSNVVSNTGGRGEDVSKSTTFMQFVPELVSSIRLDQDAYGCCGTLGVSLIDRDLAGMGAAMVDVMTSGGDMETISLSAFGATGEFVGTLGLMEADVVTGNGQLEIGPGVTITVAYTDLEHAQNAPDELTDTAFIDCTAPVVSNILVGQVGTQAATVTFMADEAVSGQVRFDTSCGSLSGQSGFTSATSHNVNLQGLMPSTTYFFFVEAFDGAGNETIADNGGACFTFTTAESTEYYTEYFPSSAPDLPDTMIQFTPTESGNGFRICQSSITALPYPTSSATPLVLGDDDAALISMEGGAQFPFFGTMHARFYVNSNGNITFGASDLRYNPTTATHFQVPRISACFTDLNPSAGGQVFYTQLTDRMVVPWAGCP